MTFDEVLTGKTEAHLVPFDSVLIHRDVEKPLRVLQTEARKAGLDLRIASGFRAFSRQLQIWNDKASGRRKVFDSNGAELDLTSMSEVDRVYAILRWSALPAGSRHHWGTDFDVYDAAAVPADYAVQLTPQESDGVFNKLHAWLDQNLDAHGFYRPYRTDRGGVAPERWHLSYAPVSQTLQNSMRLTTISHAIAGETMELKQVVFAELATIFDRFVINTDPPPTA